MKHILPFVLTIATAAWPGQRTAPAPTPNTAFTIPLDDGRQATAVILPGNSTAAWLVYATPDGVLCWYLLTPTTPAPPTPPVTPPPTPVLPPEYNRPRAPAPCPGSICPYTTPG